MPKMICVINPILNFKAGERVPLEAASPELVFWAENGSRTQDALPIASLIDEPDTPPEVTPIDGEPKKGKVKKCE